MLLTQTRPAPPRRQLYNVPWTLVAFTFGKATVVRAVEEPLLPLAAGDSAAGGGGAVGGGGDGDDDAIGRARRTSFNHVEALDTEPPTPFRAPARANPMPRTLSFEARLAVAAQDAAQSTGRLLGGARRLALRELPLTAALLSICIACVAPLQALLFNGGPSPDPNPNPDPDPNPNPNPNPNHHPHPNQALLFNGGPLDFIGGGTQMLGACSPPVSTLVMASGLWSVYGTLTSQRRAGRADATSDAPPDAPDGVRGGARDGARERAVAAALPPCKLVLLSCGLRLLVVPAICQP